MTLLIILHPSKNKNTKRGFCLIPGEIIARGKHRAFREQSVLSESFFTFRRDDGIEAASWMPFCWSMGIL
jgi:hypothetical protein